MLFSNKKKISHNSQTGFKPEEQRWWGWRAAGEVAARKQSIKKQCRPKPLSLLFTLFLLFSRFILFPVTSAVPSLIQRTVSQSTFGRMYHHYIFWCIRCVQQPPLSNSPPGAHLLTAQPFSSPECPAHMAANLTMVVLVPHALMNTAMFGHGVRYEVE